MDLLEAPVALDSTKNPEMIDLNESCSTENIDTADQDEPETSMRGTQTGKFADDTFSLLGEEDTKEEACKYKQYLCLLREIRAQNSLIARYKQRLEVLCERTIKTSEDIDEYRQIEEVLKTENERLQELVEMAIHLQNTGSKRNYGFIPIETMPDEF